jgi:hypothetical protein
MEGSDDPGQREDESVGEQCQRFALDEFYQALASSHRRRLLYYLDDTDDSTVEELTSVLSGWEATSSGTMQTSTDRSDIQIGLVHDHLPRLANIDLIEYDADAGIVQLKPLHPRVKDVIQQSIEAEQRCGPK